MKKIDPHEFRVKPGEKVNLAKWPTLVKPVYESAEEYSQILHQHIDQLSAQQSLLYASASHALLLIFQALDAAGKDGAIAHVMSGVNPQGCEVFSFKHPSDEDLSHDFLWNAVTRLPERGRIGIFNRSYYEEVLILRVHPELLGAEGFAEADARDKDFWRNRYRSIVDLEAHLDRNHTRILKFYLHLSRQEQRKRFLKRIDDPSKNWKLSLADIEERKYWKHYIRAYEHCLTATSSAEAPWYIVPADDKENTRLIVSEIIVDAVQSLDLHYPKTDPSRRKELKSIREALLKS